MKIKSPNSTIWYKQWQNKFKNFNKNKKSKKRNTSASITDDDKLEAWVLHSLLVW